MPSPIINPNLMMSENNRNQILEAIDVEHQEIEDHIPDLNISWLKSNKDTDIAVIDGHE